MKENRKKTIYDFNYKEMFTNEHGKPDWESTIVMQITYQNLKKLAAELVKEISHEKDGEVLEIWLHGKLCISEKYSYEN